MNRAIKLRIYPDKEQEKQLAKTFGCCRFLYNRMLEDKIREYEKNKKMLRNTPAAYKTEFPWLKEVDALALANVQLHLERAYKNFFGNPAAGFPKYKAKHRSRQSYTTNVVNGNIRLEEGKLKLPKMSPLKVKQHRGLPVKKCCGEPGTVREVLCQPPVYLREPSKEAGRESRKDTWGGFCHERTGRVFRWDEGGVSHVL